MPITPPPKYASGSLISSAGSPPANPFHHSSQSQYTARFRPRSRSALNSVRTSAIGRCSQDFVNKLDSEEVLHMASRSIFNSGLLCIPPFGTEDPENWRALLVENLPREETCADLLQILKPFALESAQHVQDYCGSGRVELRFLNHTYALLFYSQFLLNPVSIVDNEFLGLTWSAAPPLDPEMMSDHASRIVLIELASTKDDTSISRMLRDKLSSYGVVETLAPSTKCKRAPDEGPQCAQNKSPSPNHHQNPNQPAPNQPAPNTQSAPEPTRVSAWKVYFTSIQAAVSCRRELDLDGVRSISFCRDDLPHKLQRQAALLHLCKSPYEPTNLHRIPPHELMRALAHQSLASVLVNLISGGEFNIGNRCICISRLPHGTKLVEICNTVRGGMLEHIKLVPDKHICFVTFLEPTAAAQFWATYQMTPFYINCERIRVGWGNNPGPLAPEIASIVARNVTRNVCIQYNEAELMRLENSTDESEQKQARMLTDENVLHQMFQPFGTIEQVRVARDVSCSFITFTNILNAAQAVDWARKSNQFTSAVVQYGKDRCAGLPRCVSRSKCKESPLLQFLRKEVSIMYAQIPLLHSQLSTPLSVMNGSSSFGASPLTSMTPSLTASSVTSPSQNSSEMSADDVFRDAVKEVTPPLSEDEAEIENLSS